MVFDEVTAEAKKSIKSLVSSKKTIVCLPLDNFIFTRSAKTYLVSGCKHGDSINT